MASPAPLVAAADVEEAKGLIAALQKKGNPEFSSHQKHVSPLLPLNKNQEGKKVKEITQEMIDAFYNSVKIMRELVKQSVPLTVEAPKAPKPKPSVEVPQAKTVVPAKIAAAKVAKVEAELAFAKVAKVEAELAFAKAQLQLALAEDEPEAKVKSVSKPMTDREILKSAFADGLCCWAPCTNKKCTKVHDYAPKLFPEHLRIPIQETIKANAAAKAAAKATPKAALEAAPKAVPQAKAKAADRPPVDPKVQAAANAKDAARLEELRKPYKPVFTGDTVWSEESDEDLDSVPEF